MIFDAFIPEFVMVAISVVIFICVYHWQSAKKLTHSDVDKFITTLEKHIPKNWPDKEEFISRLRQWGYEDDGKPLYMLNLMRFFDNLAPGYDLNPNLSPQTANKQYEDAVMPMLFKVGGTPYFSGQAQGIGNNSNLIVYDQEHDNWDRILVIKYPGRRAFMELVCNPDYLEYAPLKLAALKVVLTPMRSEIMVPNPTWISLGALTIVVLAFSLVRQLIS